MARAAYEANSAPHLVRGSLSVLRSHSQILSAGSRSVSCGSGDIIVLRGRAEGGGCGDAHPRLPGSVSAISNSLSLSV